MPNDLYKYIEKLRHEKKKRRQLTAVMTAMSVFVSSGVFWQLRGIGTAMTDEDADISSAGNIASQLSSGHELAEESLASLPSELTGSVSEDTALVAESQKGYISAEDGRSRYGDWYGSPYAEWNTMFTYFCLYHAGVKKESLPYGSGCWAWSAELEKLGIIHDMCNGPPSRGDILLLDSDCDGEADRSCIVTGITDNTIKAVEGNVEGCVAEVEYSADDECIKGYITLEDIPPEIPEEPYMPAQELSACSASGIQVIASYPENVFPADTEMFVTDISSDIAEATAADALSADMSQVTAVAVDISFHTPDGTEIEPADDSSVSVTILLPDEKALPDGQLSLLHVDDEGGVSTVENAELTGNSAVFTAESFSVYIINLYEGQWESWHVGDDHYVNGNIINIDSIKNNSESNPYIVHLYNWVDVETYATDVYNDYFTVWDNNINASTKILERRNGSDSDIVEYDQSRGSYTRKGAFQAINAGSCEIVLKKGGVNNIFYLKVVDNTDVYVNTALGEIHKDKVHEYLDRVDQYSSDSYYLSDENGKKRQYFKNLEGKNGYRIYVGHTVELSAYVPTWKAAGTDFNVDVYGDHNASNYLVKIGNTVRTDMGDGTTRISAVFQAVKPQNGATWAQRTGVSLKGDGIYEYFYVVVDTSPTKTINHSDIEIADGGKYVTKKKVTYPDGTQQTVETEYLAYVSGINKCKILDSDGQVVETFNNSDYWFDPQFSPGDSQYEYTSQFIVDANNNTIISQKNFRLSDSYRADFDISVLLKPSKETLYDANGDIISEKSLIGTADDITVPSTVVHMSHQSLIDAYNKCPDHSGLDFTLRDVDFLSSAILSAKKIVEGGSLQEGTFEFLLLDNDDVNYSYVSVPVGENTVQITPVSGHYYEMYQISRPTVMDWGSSVTDSSALFNAVQEAYNSVSVDKMYSPSDVDSKIIQKYISGSSSALPKEDFTAILLEYIDQNEPILPLNGVFTAEGDGTCIIIDRKIVSTAKNDADGYIRFPEIVYGNTGTHNYMIREMIPAESKGYFYDKGYLNVRVDISQDEQGQLSAAIDPSQEKTFKNTAIYTLPSTGGIGVIPFIAAGSVCTIAALLLIIHRRKEMQ